MNKKNLFFIAVVLKICIFLLPITLNAIENFSENEIIYFALIDRFFDGDKTNNFNVNTKNPKSYHGGDIQGLIEKISYIKKLGVTSVLLSPFFDNRDNDFFGSYGFHGYWIKDFFKVDEHFGDIKLFNKFVEICHKNNIKVIIDMVLNHCEWDCDLVKKHPNWFSKYGNITDWNNQFQIENYKMGGLPDFNQNKKEVYDFLINLTKYWIRTTNCDGIRLDAVKHIPKKFWKNFIKDIKAFSAQIKKDNFIIIGEVLNGDVNYIKEYFDIGIPALFDFPLYYKIKETFAKNGNINKLINILEKDRIYTENVRLVSFIDNHDVERFFSSSNNDITRMKLALGFIFSIRGWPCIYYGTELPIAGLNENEGRKTMKFNDLRLYEFLRKLIKIRKNHLSLSNGEFVVRYCADDVIVFQKILEKEEALILMNKSGVKKDIKFTPLKNSYFFKNMNNKDLISDEKISFGLSQNNELTLTLKPYDFKIYYKKYSEKHFDLGKLKSKNNVSSMSNVKFEVTNNQTKMGQQIYIVGNVQELGNWDAKKAKGPFLCPKWPIWNYEIKLPYSFIEYKFIIKDEKSEKIIWESGENRVLNINQKQYKIRGNWK